MNYALSLGCWSNNTLTFSTDAKMYIFTINGSETECPKTLVFENAGDFASFEYLITYIDEYGFEYSFTAYLVRKNVDVNIDERGNTSDKVYVGVSPEEGDIVGAFFGHDHMNDFEGYVDDIYMAQNKLSGFFAYTDGCRSGVRLLTLNENEPHVFESKMIRFKELGLSPTSLGPITSWMSDRVSVNLTIARNAALIAGGVIAAGVITKKIIDKKRKDK